MSDPEVSSVAGQVAGAAYERLQEFSVNSASGRGPMAKGSAMATGNPFAATSTREATSQEPASGNPTDIYSDAAAKPSGEPVDASPPTVWTPGECLDVKVPIVVDGKEVEATTQGCIGPEGEILIGAASRGKAALRGYGLALGEAEKRIDGDGLSRRQAVKIADAAAKDPEKARMLKSREDLSRVVAAMVEGRQKSRADQAR